MAKKIDIDFLIQRIKSATGLTQEGIADAIHYSRPHFSTMKRDTPEKLYQLLEKHFEDALESKNVFSDTETVEYIKRTKDLNAMRALVDLLLLEMAKVKSKLYGVSIEDAIDELEKNARIALRQIEKGGA